MPQKLRTRGDVFRHVAMVTLACIAASVATTLVLYLAIVGGDPDVTFTAREVLAILLCISISVPAVVPPFMSYRMTCLLRDLTLARDTLDRLSQTDQLTGLANRRGFDRRATELLAQAQGGGAAVAAAMADIDHFKSINDELGHDVGDAALRHVAQVLQDFLQHRNVAVGRQGGDEFAILTCGLHEDEVLDLCEQIRRTVEGHELRVGDRRMAITMSFGLALFARPEERLGAFMSAADSALLEAKRRGRNRVHVFAAAPAEMAS